ncbi:hypothetical protein HRbin36_01871 [bacterium HR36]|nr:hypothetical protein HRbin36_01871 [bacterium HR36]
MVQFRQEHRRHAVNGCASLLVNGLQSRQWVERFCGYDHGGSVDHAHQCAHHAAKTVVKRHRNTQAVLLTECQTLADVVGVHKQITVRQHRTFRKTSSAGSVLDVDDIVWADE